MAPNFKDVEEFYSNESEKQIYKPKIVWKKVYQFSLLHFVTLYGIYLMFTAADWKTSLFSIALGHFATLGISAGAHRLWSHRSYKARWPLRILLCILNTIAFQNDIYEWSRDHRVHHKCTETDADPHNIKRGFFFAHIGWLMCRKHPDVINKGKTIPLNDLWADPIVRFQRRFYKPLVAFFSFYLPTMIPVWCWSENIWTSFYVAGIARYCLSLHCTLLINSVAHKYGNQPYDKYIEARENRLLAVLMLGDGWHNYHHVFPWDYSSSELGYTLNLTKVFIDFMAWIGLAYDLKTADANTVRNKKLKSGDGTRLNLNDNPQKYEAYDLK